MTDLHRLKIPKPRGDALAAADELRALMASV
jgi:hypothetical protein